MDLSFILNELGEERENYFNAVSPPIMQSSNFSFKDVAGLREAMSDEFESSLYSRGQNPTLNILRKKLAALDGAEDALLFSSGISAISVPILSLLKSGDHIIAVDNLYSWTIKLFKDFLPKFGITTTFIDGTVFENFGQAATPQTRLIYLESPNTFCYELQDIRKVTDFAKSRGIITMIDNSYCSPLYQQPISMGVDLVAQSATKYIGGHSDVVAGVLTGSKAVLKKIFDHEFMNTGPALSPHSAWLLLRGLRTLPLRLQRSFESTRIITEWLASHPAVQDVIWPFSPKFNQADLVSQQMQGCGGLFSLILKHSSFNKIERFCNSLKHILLAVSWGGHESLVVPAIASFSEDEYSADNDHHQLIRMYIGLEDPQYLIADIKQALEK
ncbi:aminotransferase class I/II-fold pyridoxal phosphate-dependent enzyme [Mucilaginibacter rubeus]|uniref:Aminotransferase class I/II-fold pyridoxal phosphate-dependent enzyme n=1 Tax=Mucilaginibacter rubeus TaxID=2027860 RepID=A0AAE6JFN9_9SPHI|nr:MULTISPECIES: aminotransferase class I/II-fold pyridoxal phosphate-dependent enzyme [Mucilaginibacter]QEM04676.1 aminotransferase class I/II-fold pyridoxal phosphate-dependent enzyme [Mucilaginibacter rubeus]QEM17269.1 aminotransferase class I/II-fold pyridoxal phosphate-dependent enzyme [Mucilaginibacter gossypii]QTE46220.1 aminotransferase class I/II-fold pyridoxal phosphate-dependent enzyme [Mucilaginibacter rubeus]QTE52817.1 aminotransferase class I/II-fold pyridoxal phosphate-dependent 